MITSFSKELTGNYSFGGKSIEDPQEEFMERSSPESVTSHILAHDLALARQRELAALRQQALDIVPPSTPAPAGMGDGNTNFIPRSRQYENEPANTGQHSRDDNDRQGVL